MASRKMKLPSIGRQAVNNINSSDIENGHQQAASLDQKKRRPQQPEHALKCPRCDSANTKFCYYNNYSLTQPRYFCKACRRYWTKGGTLRNVPVGGGCRKNKRSSVKRALDAHHHNLLLQNSQRVGEHNVLSSVSDQNNQQLSNFSSPLSYETSGDTLSLAFARLQKQCNGHLGFDFDHPQIPILGGQQASSVFGAPLTSNLLDQNLQHINQRSTANLGFLNNFLDTQQTPPSSYTASQSLYNYGFENGGDQNQDHSHSQPLLPYEDLSLSNNETVAAAVGVTYQGFNNLSAAGSVVKPELRNGFSDNRILRGFPWQMESNEPSQNNNNHGGLVLGSNMNNNGRNGYELSSSSLASGAGGVAAMGAGIESWNNSGLAAAQTWPNLINSALM